jgi:dTDP-4-dehydrorhamnose reductase
VSLAEPFADLDPRVGLMELWGGHECTVNRVHGAWFDQTQRSGHDERPEDLKLFADLGIRRLRYPALWERISPGRADQRDFAWTDERLAEIARLGMEPILTLCHHGSGPHYTSLLDDGFAPGLARHAAAVAERYPWVTDYTPVNEPLTTARFSALYGFWYPHHRDEEAFWRALLNETDATRLAMRAIRRINPQARLIQTDDLGYCHATAPLLREAAYQNERRWMGWDLLCGTVTPGHALWDRLVDFGLEARLRAIADDPCPPDVIGINHYLSSERLLDHRIELHGARGLADRELGECEGIAHVDVDAARNLPGQVLGLSELVQQTWERYRLPIAITECHNGSTREEQARWFIDVWDKAEALRREGVDVRSVTAWSLLGAHDWNRMVTEAAGHYEPGVFDIRGGVPRPTLMARVLADLARGERPSGPGLDVPGWWHPERHAWHEPAHGFAVTAGPGLKPQPRPLAIVDGDPLLTRVAVAACEARGLHHALVDGGEGQLAALHPWAVLDLRLAAGDVTQEALARSCRTLGIVGAILHPHDPETERVPVPDSPRDMLVVETGPVFDAADEEARAVRLLDELDLLRRGDRLRVEAWPRWTGVYAPTLVDGVLDLLLDGLTGTVHFVAEEDWSLADVARLIATVAGHQPCAIVDKGSFIRIGAGRPVQSYLPPLVSMIERFVHDRRRCRADRANADHAYMLEAAE